MAVVAQWTFDSGTPEVGGAWTWTAWYVQQDGTPETSVSGGVGRIILPDYYLDEGGNGIWLSDVLVGDVDVVVRAWYWNVGSTPDTRSSFGGAAARVSGTNAYYSLRTVSGISIRRVTSGSHYDVASTTATVNQNVRLEAVGSSPTTLRLRHWSGTEGGSWDIETSDNTGANQMATGKVGVYGSVSANGTSDYSGAQFDDFTATTPEALFAWDGSGITLDAYLTKTFSGTLTANAVIKATVSAGKTITANAVLKVNSGTKTFTANAVIRRTATPTLTANAVIKANISSGKTADAVLKKAISGSFAANAVLGKNQTGSFTADSILKRTATQTFSAAAWFAGIFTVDAWIGAGAVQGSFTADAILKANSGTKTFSADAALLKVGSGSFTLDAILAKTTTPTFAASAAIKATPAASFTANAVVGKTIAASFTANAVVRTTIAVSFTADAAIKSTLPSSLALDAVINSVSKCIWTTPGNTVQIISTETLTFLMPTAARSSMHFQIHLDTVATYDGIDLRVLTSHSDLTGWEYWDGGDWQPIPQEGVANTYCGNEARYTVQTPLAGGTWYRHVRAGVI